MKTVQSQEHVITELWKVPANKSLSCLLGDMESCETEDIVIGEDDNDGANKSKIEQIDNKTFRTKTDYRDHLVVHQEPSNSSDYDTDDLIEDAKNFVRAANEKFVDVDGWREIDEKRRQTRLTRKERNQKLSAGLTSGGEEPNAVRLSGHFVPQRVSDLRLGFGVKTIAAVGSKVCRGVVR